jgi:hypothetical protein
MLFRVLTICEERAIFSRKYGLHSRIVVDGAWVASCNSHFTDPRNHPANKTGFEPTDQIVQQVRTIVLDIGTC